MGAPLGGRKVRAAPAGRRLLRPSEAVRGPDRDVQLMQPAPRLRVVVRAQLHGPERVDRRFGGDQVVERMLAAVEHEIGRSGGHRHPQGSPVTDVGAGWLVVGATVFEGHRTVFSGARVSGRPHSADGAFVRPKSLSPFLVAQAFPLCFRRPVFQRPVFQRPAFRLPVFRERNRRRSLVAQGRR